ncbi:MAG: transposase [Rhodospirillales bacterium]
MARLARVVLSNIPHHVTQRGNGRARTFFSDADYAFYRDLLAEHCRQNEISILGWCLMPNHVHLLLTPRESDGLRSALAKVHRAYAGHVHAREKRTGHFWQGRFGCVALDEAHLIAAMAYGALNPVRARLAKEADAWPWSAIHAYREPHDGDNVTDIAAVAPYRKAALAMIDAGVALAEEDERLSALRKGETIGRPVGDKAFLEKAETLTGRTLRPKKRGRKTKKVSETAAKNALSP